MKVPVNSFSPFALVAESDIGGSAGTELWWAKLPGFVQWILRWLCFGWLWMK
jgi:hypothetical protein